MRNQEERGGTVGRVSGQTDNQAARVRIPANTNGFFLCVFLGPGGSEPT